LLLIALAVVVLYLVGNHYFNRKTSRYFSSLFEQQQRLHVSVSSNAIDESIERLLGQMRVLGQYSFVEYEQGMRTAASMRRLFAEEQRAYGEVSAFAFYTAPGEPELANFDAGTAGEEAREAMRRWTALYWSRVRPETSKRSGASRQFDPFVPPFYTTEEVQLIGFLLPVVVEGEFRGVLTVAMNLGRFIARYMRPFELPGGGEQFITSEQGSVVWSAQAGAIGKAAAERYPYYRRLPQTGAGSRGLNEGGTAIRVAWSSVEIGSRHLTIYSAVSSTGSLEVPNYITLWRYGFLLLFVLFLVVGGYYGIKLSLLRQRRVLDAENEEQLRQQVAERTRKLESAMRHYRLLFEGANDGILILDRGFIIDCNRRAAELFEMSAEELVGKNPALLAPEYQPDGSRSDRKGSHYLFESRRTGSVIFEWVHRSGRGRDFPTEVSLNTVELEGGRVVQALIRDITDRKEGELQLRRALEERSVMLRELHHRVKSNLQLMESIIALERSVTASEEAREILQHVSRRILTISGVHEIIYEHQDLSSIDTRQYLETLLEELKAGYLGAPCSVEYRIEPLALFLDTALSLGFVVGEVVEYFLEESSRRAGPDGDRLTVSLKAQEEGLRLFFKEERSAEGRPVVPPEGLAWEIVENLAAQLKAEVRASAERGELELRFPEAP
jgi:PAS domain S-box-containing protein